MCTFSTQAVLSSVFTSIHPLFSCQKQSWTLYLTILKPQTSYTNTNGLVPLLSVSSAAGICWLYAGKVSGRCKWEGAWGGAGGLGGTTEKVLASGGGAGACREKITVEFTLRYVQVRADVSACSDVYMWCVCFFVPYTGGFGGDGAVYVSHGFQDVEGNKSDLVEAISALPPALGWFNHLSDGGDIIVHMKSNPLFHSKL